MVTSATSPAASSSPASLGTQIAVAIQARTLQIARDQGSQITSLIDAAGSTADQASPSSVSAGDALVAKATGLGGQLDVTA